MKKRSLILIFAAVFAVMLAACADSTPQPPSNPPAEPGSSQAQPLGNGDLGTSVEEEKPQEKADGSAELTYVNEELGITFDLPEMLGGRTNLLVEEKEYYGETAHAVELYYTGGTQPPQTDVHVLTIEVMSQKVWEQMRAEGARWGR